MASLNKMIVIGNGGNDPEMRYPPDGNPVTSFNIAVSRRFTTREGERKEETEWFTVVTWNRLAETCNQCLARGRRAFGEGPLRARAGEGQDGQKRSRHEIVADKVVF